MKTFRMILFLGLVCLVTTMLASFSPTVAIAAQKRSATSSKVHSATGTFISYDGGNGMGWYKLYVNGKAEEFFMTSSSQFDRNSFLKKNSFDVGAEWKITYRYENLFDDGKPIPHIKTAFFTGRVLTSTGGGSSTHSKSKVVYYPENSDNWGYLIGEGRSEITVAFHLSEDGNSNMPNFRRGQKYYELEIRTPKGMTQFDGLIRNGIVVWFHRVQGRAKLNDTNLINIIERFVSRGKKSVSPRNSTDPVIIKDQSHRTDVLTLAEYHGLYKYIRQTH
jgi:hypothetical protein